MARGSTIAESVEALVRRMDGAPLCDECITDRLDLRDKAALGVDDRRRRFIVTPNDSLLRMGERQEILCRCPLRSERYQLELCREAKTGASDRRHSPR